MQRLLGDPVNEFKPHEEQLVLCEQREGTVGTRTAAEAVRRVTVDTFLDMSAQHVCTTEIHPEVLRN